MLDLHFQLKLSDACDMFYLTVTLVKEKIYPKRAKDINIEGYTNNHSLYETFNTAKSILYKHLRVDIYILPEKTVFDILG